MKLNAIEFSLSGKKIAALTNDNQGAPLLLCLHGWLDNAASFTPVLPYLNHFHVIAIDWPGHGLSDHRSVDAHYHFIDWVYDLVQLFENQRWTRIAILAHSMGAMVASAFAAAFPEKVASLTLVDAIGFLTLESEQTTKQLRKGMLNRLARQDNKVKYHQHLASAVTARVQVSDLTPEHAKLLVERGIEKTDKGYLWRTDSRLRAVSPYRFTEQQAKQLFGDLTTPVQLIYGSNGMEMVSLGLQHFAPLLSDFSQHQLQGGHHVHMEQATQVAKLVTKFAYAYK